MCNTLKKTLLFTCAVLLLAGPASAATFYVDDNGDPSTTFVNLDTALWTANTYPVGGPHTIFISEGDYDDVNLTVPSNVGRIIGVEPGVIFTSPILHNYYLLNVSGTIGLEIAGLAITGYNVGIEGSAVTGLDVHDCELFNNNFGMSLSGGGSLYDNIGYNNTTYAIQLWDNDWSIHDNCFYGQPGVQVYDGTGGNTWTSNYYSDLADTDYPIGGSGNATDWNPVMSDNEATTVDDTPEVNEVFDVNFMWTDGKKCDPTSQGLGAYSFTVNFDENRLEYVPQSGGFDYDLLGNPNPATYILTDNSAAGELIYVGANMDSPGFGDARLAFAKFKAIGLVGSWITITSTYVDGDGDVIVTTSTDLVLYPVDEADPTITVVVADTVGDNTFGEYNNLWVSGDVTDNWELYYVDYAFDGGGWHNIGYVYHQDDTYGPFMVDLSLITGDGTHTLNMRVKDDEGNYGYVDHDFTLDNTPPDFTGLLTADTDPCADSGWTSNVTVDVTWDEPGDAVLMRLEETVSQDPVAYEMPTTYTFAVGDGTKTLNVQLCDAYGNWSSMSSSAISLDQTAPVPSGAWLVVDGATPAKTNTKSIVGNFTKGSGIYFNFSENAGDLVCDDKGWVTTDGPYAIELSDDDEVKTVFFASKDEAGNIGITSASIELDETGPVITTISVTDITGSDCSDGFAVDVNVTFTDTNADIVYLYLTTNADLTQTRFDVSGDVAAAGSMTVIYTLDADDRDDNGVNEVHAQLRDDVYNYGPVVTGDIIVDMFNPVAGSMELNGGDMFADSAVVEVTISGMSSDIELFRVAETLAALGTASWVDFADSVFDYDFGTPAEGSTQELWAQFSDCADRVSGEISDGIIFDLTPPVVTDVEINSGDAYTNNKTVWVSFTIDEDYPSEVCISNTADMYGAICDSYGGGGPYLFDLDPIPGDGSRTVWVTLEDAFGHVCAPVESAPIILDETKPTAGDFVVISGNPLAAAGYTNSLANNTYSFTPAEADVDEILIRTEDDSPTMSWFPVSGDYPQEGTIPFSLESVSGVCTVEWYYKDFAGNLGGPFHTIILASSGAPSYALAVVATPDNCIKLEVTTPGADDQFYFFRYNFTGEYPQYPSGASPHPAIDQGFAGMEMGTGDEHIYATEWFFDNPLMDIFSFSVWVVNNYGVVSPSPDAGAKATNYYLGDFNNSGVLEFVEDFGQMAIHYGETDADAGWAGYAHCDFASDILADPTGLPDPDGTIGFPDLLVFAQNYRDFGEHAKDGGVYKAGSPGQIAVTADVPGYMKAGDEYVISLKVDNSSAILGYDVVLEYNRDQFEVVSVTQGAMHNDVRSFFYHNTKTSDLQVSGVVLGDRFEGNEIARITVRAMQSGVFELTDLELTFLDADNNPIEATFGLEKSVEIPLTFALSQNYPNPFNPTTTIELSLPMAADYSLVIYNITGQVVESFSGHAEAGITPITWDAIGLGSGVYFYRIETASFTDTKKMVLLK